MVISTVKDYQQFTDLLERSIHNPVHIAINGDMNTNAAPNDPIFWPFHAYIDKIWSDWQKRNNMITIRGIRTGLNEIEQRTELPPLGVTAIEAEYSPHLCYTYE